MPAFFILKENRRVRRMGPQRAGGEQGSARPSLQRAPNLQGPWEWRPHWADRTGTGGVRLPSEGLLSLRSTHRTLLQCRLVVSRYTASIGIPATRDKGPDRKGGWGRRVWFQSDFQATKAPRFPQASIRALQPKGASRKLGKEEGPGLEARI
jgi:hypothetical protein